MLLSAFRLRMFNVCAVACIEGPAIGLRLACVLMLFTTGLVD